MEAFLSNPWYLLLLLVTPAVIFGLAKSLKRFNAKVAEKAPHKKDVEAEA